MALTCYRGNAKVFDEQQDGRDLELQTGGLHAKL